MDKPNIVLINCDDLGYGDLGCYGSELNKTPAIDRLADNGMRFTDFYMASPLCSPSRGGMLTGCYPNRIGFGEFEGIWVLLPGQSVGLNPEETTIASMLKEVGYNTKLIGKWHCGDQKEFLPTNHGFDSYYGLPYSNDMGRQANRPDVDYPPLPLVKDDEVIQEQPDQSTLTERYVEQAVGFIRDNKENPFFLYMAHMHVHLPHYAPDRFMKQSDNGEYGAAVECIDWSTDVIVKELEKQGLSENTLVIFTSDNGSNRRYGGSNAPLRGQKAETWEGGMRVPCIMYWPGTIDKDQERSSIVSSIDFLPTIAEITGASVPSDRIIDGLDVSGLLLRDGDCSPRKSFFYYKMNSLEAIRHGKWKLHLRKDDDHIKELYDLEADISETNNLYNQYPEVVKKLSELAADCMNDMGDDKEGIVGKNTRLKGKVENPETLTHYDPDHPYIIALYDKNDAG